jgi:hypothetical protein
VVDFREDILDDFEVVEMFELIVENQDTKSDLINGIGQFLALVGRVDVDQDEVSDGCCKLHHHPFILIVCVDPDSVFGFQAELPHQTSRQLLSLVVELLVC